MHFVLQDSSASDGSAAVYVNGAVFFETMVIEGKESMGENNGGWSFPQCVLCAGEVVSKHIGEPVVQGTCCPMLGFEVMGYTFR